MFIKLTSLTGLNEGKPIYVNMDQIIYFREMVNSSQKGSFMVNAENGVIKVKEKPDEIIAIISWSKLQSNTIPLGPFQLDSQSDRLWSAEWREQCRKENQTIADAGNQSTEGNSHKKHTP